jgi:RNA polymerase primary sigma factor
VDPNAENWADAYVRKAQAAPRVTPSEASVLVGLAREGDTEALAALVEASRRLVVSVAWKYVRQMDFGDALRFGDEGLSLAVNHFQGSKDVPFATYATWWIRQAITRGCRPPTPAI